MDADWSVECGADDPTIAVPWSKADGDIEFVDLRTAPERIVAIAEAQQHPALAEALCAWNQAASPFFTAKCDVWNYPAAYFDAEDDPRFAFAQASYVDLLHIADAEFCSFTRTEQQVRQWCAAARALGCAGARCEWVVRRAWRSSALDSPQLQADAAEAWTAGFAVTLYVWGYGATETEADAAWAQALRALLPLLRAACLATQRIQ
jgi:hypothetical protein